MTQSNKKNLNLILVRYFWCPQNNLTLEGQQEEEVEEEVEEEEVVVDEEEEVVAMLRAVPINSTEDVKGTASILFQQEEAADTTMDDVPGEIPVDIQEKREITLREV